MTNSNADLQKLASTIKDIQFTMMATVNEDGHIHSRPMATLKVDAQNFDGILWFFSKTNSQKNHNIENDQHVNLAYSNPDKQSYISICGKAEISQDKAKMQELWNPMYKAWFPEGLDDPTISLIGVHIESAEIWDSPSSKMVQAYGFVKAAITGKPYKNAGENLHIDLNHKNPRYL